MIHERSKGAGVFGDLAFGGASVAVTAAGVVVPVIPSSLSVQAPRYRVADDPTGR